MIRQFFIAALLLSTIAFVGCKKDAKITKCNSSAPTIRQITNKKATIKVTATVTEEVYLVEEGTIDTRLIPCNLPKEFYEDGLQVTISGNVKAISQNTMAPCCVQGIDITAISQ